MKPGSELAREGMSSSFQVNAVVTGPVSRQGKEEDTSTVEQAGAQSWCIAQAQGTPFTQIFTEVRA